jgi:N6-L-threonylcarbamoyladenine synthase
MLILGIESSCDDSAAAVVIDGRRIQSSVVASQTRVHHRYGGVVPELASRQHVQAIMPVTRQALDEAGLKLADIDAIAVTQGPGLIGSLLVGFNFARALAYGLEIPWVGVNHLDGHIHSIFLQPDPPDFPFVALLASGGHTSLYHVTSHTAAKPLGHTRDDAAGEAFDKVAKMLGLGYPGGRVIAELAAKGDPAKIPFPRAYMKKAGFDFSFSGMKTAARQFIEANSDRLEEMMPHIAAGFQEAVVDVLEDKLTRAMAHLDCPRAAMVGGVAANARLRKRLREAGARNGYRVHLPARELCGDNAAMIAAAGYHALEAGRHSGLASDVYSRRLSTCSTGPSGQGAARRE